MKSIPYSKQNINNSDVKSVIKTLKSEFITQGPKIIEFEKILCQYTGAKYSVATNSATSALHLSCLALDLKKNDIAWTVPNSFVASANCILMCGAKVDFVDIDIETNNISIKNLEEKLKISARQKKLPKVLIIVHFAGSPCEMLKINKLKKKYNFKIIEDASHALGAKYKNTKIGSCKFSDITVFSFHPVKMITTGEGGVALTNNNKIYKLMRLLRDHGIKRSISRKKKWLYNAVRLGFNYRITDIQCALGITQITRLDHWVKKRNSLAKRYNKLLSKLPLILPKIYNENLSSFHLYVIRFNQSATKSKRDHVFNFLRKKNILVNIHYIPIYHHTLYKKLKFNSKNFPNCELYYKTAITIPLFPSMSEEMQKKIVKEIKVSLL